MSVTLVNANQSESVRTMANHKRIGCERFQRALDDGSFSRFLDSLKLKSKDIKPPKSARIHVLKVKVRQDRKWHDAVNAAGPNTPSDYNLQLLGIGAQYAPVGTGTIEQELILLNFPDGGGDWEKAITWAEAQGLTRTNPREVFAISEQHPKLHRRLGQDLMYVAATTDCSFEGGRFACFVWWCGSKREARLAWVGHLGFAYGWFVFRK